MAHARLNHPIFDYKSAWMYTGSLNLVLFCITLVSFTVRVSLACYG